MPEVSVITPVYNGEAFIAEAMRSVLDQTYEDWEHILIDDASKDDTREIIEGFMEKDERIKLVENDTNSGIAYTRNRGIALASGNYIAFLDADDLWTPQKLEKQLYFMRSNKYVFTYTSYLFQKGERISRKVKIPSYLNYRRLLRSGNPIACLTVILDKRQIDVQMPDIPHEDYASWLDISKEGHTAYGLDESLAIRRIHGGMTSSSKVKALKWTWHIYRKQQHLSLPLSLRCFAGYVYHSTKKHISSGGA